MQLCDTPERAAEYWRLTVATNPYFNPECECFVVLLLRLRRKVRLPIGETFRTLDASRKSEGSLPGAIIAAAAAIIIMHNHPSGEPTPSEADIKVLDFIRAGQLLKIEVLIM